MKATKWMAMASVLLGTGCGKSSGPSVSERMEAVRSASVGPAMTADELVEPYEQNPVAAASRFDGKMVEVTGTLREFETINACSDGKERAKLYACASYPAARLNIREEGQWMFGRSVCCFNPTDDPVEKESLSRIERGQQVRVRGVVAGFAAYATSVVLYDCSIRL